MKRVGVVLVLLGGLWLAVLVMMPVYIEPAWKPTGDVNCGMSWRALSTDEFHEDAACHTAMTNRRVVLLIPAGAIAFGAAALLLNRRGRRDDQVELVPEQMRPTGQ